MDTVHIGRQYRLQVQAIDSAGLVAPMPAGTFAWTSSDPTIATVASGPGPLPPRYGAQLQVLKVGAFTISVTLTESTGATLSGSASYTAIASDPVGLTIKTQGV